MSGQAPGFVRHLGLLWGLRLRIGFNRGAPSRWWLVVPSFIASSLPSVLLASSFFALMQVPVVAESELWPEFIVRLLCFVTTCVWATWPVLSAGVDDHSELSRYSAFPISSFRLMLASTLASVLEPRSLVFYGPLVGAVSGYALIHPVQNPVVVLLAFGAYVLFNAALSRVGLHIVLDVLRQKRSAELIGGGFVVTLIAASFIPPVDTSWLLHLQDTGVDAVPDTVVRNAVIALGRFPTGAAAHALTASTQGRFAVAVADLALLIELSALALVVAWGLLIDFHRKAGRSVAQTGQARLSNPFATTRSLFSTLVVREALDLWNNPRARLLAAVPFVLAILFRLLSGRDLFVFLLQGSADAWLLTSLCVYGAIVLGSTFSQNAFAYDGQGFSVFLSAPLELGAVLKAKNLVHAVAGAALATIVGLFYVGYFQHGRPLDLAVALTAVATLIPIVVTVGNFLSLYFPVKFHANLKRRDKVPFVASMLGVAAAALGSLPATQALRACQGSAPSAFTLATTATASVIAWVVYFSTLPLAVQLLSKRREVVLRAVTRE